MKFYHDKRSAEKQEISTFPVADTVHLMDQSKDKQVNDNPWQRGY